MERSRFKVGEMYKVCPRCGEWVPAKATNCDNGDCGVQISGMQMKLVTAEDLQAEVEVSKEPEVPQTAGALIMRCHGCNNSYAWGTYTNCPSCGGTLVPEPAGVGAVNSVIPVTEQETRYESGDTYCYTLYRHTKEGEIVAKQQKIPFLAEEIFGRTKFIEDPRFFFNRVTNHREYYSVISRKNVTIRQEKGQLTVEMIPGKNRVQLNGKKLKDGVRYVLHEGDQLRFGEGNDVCHHIDVRIEKMRSNNETGGIQAIKEMLRTFQSQITSRMDGLEKTIASIRPEDLVMRANESEDEYDKRIGGLMPNMSQEEKEKKIIEFMQIKDRDGKVNDYSRQLDAVRDREQIMEYLFQATVLELTCDSMEGDMDYSVAMNMIGRAFEEFVVVKIISMVHRADEEDFTKYLEKKNANPDSVPQGLVLTYLLTRGNVPARYNPKKKIFDIHIDRIVEKAGYGSDTKNEFWELRNALQAVKDAIACRNGSSHAEASKKTKREELDKYMKLNTKKRLSKKEYLEQKEQIFASGCLTVVDKYYQRVCN